MWQITKSERSDILVGDYLVYNATDLEYNNWEVYRMQEGIMFYIKDVPNCIGVYTIPILPIKPPFDPCDKSLLGKKCKVIMHRPNIMDFGKIVSIIDIDCGDLKKGDWLVRVNDCTDLIVVPGSKERLV